MADVTSKLICTIDLSRRPGPFKCVKGMTHDTCPYNPLLGCDCGYNKPYSRSMKNDDGEEMYQ